MVELKYVVQMQVRNQDFLSAMICQTTTQNEVMLSVLKTYKEMAEKNKKKKTQWSANGDFEHVNYYQLRIFWRCN